MATWQDVLDLGTKLNEEMQLLTLDRSANEEDKQRVTTAEETEAESRQAVSEDAAQIDGDRQLMHSLIDEIYATSLTSRARARTPRAA